ncbi:hypothetical protein [Streptomyces prasinosporus]|uniref:hypothetical protein n=1 Tax=Streptomyces prasinosporus TaxID=68256 RepID=UPI003CD05D66
MNAPTRSSCSGATASSPTAGGWELAAGRGRGRRGRRRAAAARELEEETGWRPGPPAPPDERGAVQRTHRRPPPHLLGPTRASTSVHPVDAFESDRREWVPPESGPRT